MSKNRKLIEDDYLGDGVYASYDGFQIVLDLRAQPQLGHICRIALESSVLDALIGYRDRIDQLLRKHNENEQRKQKETEQEDS